MAHPPARHVAVVNTLGTLSYIAIVIQWLWSLLIVGYPLIISAGLLTHEEAPQMPTQSYDFGGFSPFVIIVAVSVTAVVMIIAIIALAKLPKQVGQQGARISRSASAMILPVVTHHQTVSKRRQIRLSYQIIMSIRMIAIILPLIALFCAQPIAEMEPRLVWLIAVWCAIWSCLWTVGQITAAYLLKVPRDYVW